MKKSYSSFAFVFFFAFLISFSLLFSQSDTILTNVYSDTLLHKPISSIGSIPTFIGVENIDKKRFVEGDILSFDELIEKNTKYKFLTFGTPGNSPILNEYGLIYYPIARGNLNPLYFLPTYYTSFELAPLLLYSSIEVVSGFASYILDKNSNGLLFNFTTRKFNTKIPYTQLWIGQAGYDYLGSSAVFSQNFLKDVNFFFIYQRYWSAGRYSNSNSDRWNLVAGFRWFANPKLNFYLENKYTILNNGLFGGLNPDNSTIIFDNNFSVVNFEHLNRKISQNDLSFNYTYIFSPDTSIYLDGGLLVSFSSQEFELEDYFAEFFKVNSKSKYKSNGLFISSRLVINEEKYKVYFGGEIEKRNQNGWLFYRESKNFEPSLFFHLSKLLGDNLEIKIGSRINKEFENITFSLGSKLTYTFDTATKTYFDLTYAQKSDYGPYRRNFLGILGFSNNSKKFELLADIFGRSFFDFKINSIVGDTLGNILLTESVGKENINVVGGDFRVGVLFLNNFKWTTKANVSYILSSDGRVREWLPTIILSNELSYRFVRGASYLDLGVELTLLSPFRGLYFHPLYPKPVEYETRRDWQINGLSAFACAKLGNAFVNVSIRNIFSVNYYYIPIYPEYDRNIRITVFWSFTD